MQASQVYAGPGDRYQGVLELVRAPGGLDIRGSGRVGRTSEVRFDISLTISTDSSKLADIPYNDVLLR